MRDHFQLFSRYNLWANRTLYDAVAALPAEEIARDRRGFFGSILGTLNHVLLGDRVWFARMMGEEYGWFQSLDQILFAEFDVLRQEREATDRQIVATVAKLPLDGDLAYRNSRGESMRVPRTVVLGHVFNHQTHHRGQVHGMLSQAGYAPPPLDLIYFPRDHFQP